MRKVKYSLENVRKAVAENLSTAGVLRQLGLRPIGGNYRTINRIINENSIDTSHFTGQGWNVGLKFNPKEVTRIEDILVKDSFYQSYKLKKRLIREGIKKECCESCGLTEWLGKPIPLEMHHMNGDNRDNRLANLQLLCPNCHALTDNYRGLNKSAHRETDGVELP